MFCGIEATAAGTVTGTAAVSGTVTVTVTVTATVTGTGTVLGSAGRQIQDSIICNYTTATDLTCSVGGGVDWVDLVDDDDGIRIQPFIIPWPWPFTKKGIRSHLILLLLLEASSAETDTLVLDSYGCFDTYHAEG